MKTRAVVAGGLLAIAGGWAIMAFGQGVYDTPAEFPPASYEGRQYVDSRGCVYIRAGIDGVVTWVPRVTRNREVICGQIPTFTPEQLAALASGAVLSNLPDLQALDVPGSGISVELQTAPAPHPNVVNDIYVPPSTDTLTSNVVNDIYVPTVDGTVSGAADGTVVNDIYVGETAGTGYTKTVPVSAQSAAGTVVNDIFVPTGQTQSSGSETAALQVGIPNSNANRIPAGFRAAWDDDRLNPHRGPRSSSGDASMYSVWTEEVPMRAADGSGRSGGILGLGSRVRAVAPFTSTKTAPAEAPVTNSAVSGGFIQVGVYSVEGNASKTLGRLARMGLPVAVQQTGRTQTVLAGPFDNGQTLAKALRMLRQNGYSDAFRSN